MLSIYSKNKFSIREGDFEVLISHCNLNDANKITPELVKYHKVNSVEHCWALAMWEYDDHEPCWEMKAVGERLFTDIPDDKIKSVWNMIKMLDRYLNYADDDVDSNDTENYEEV